MSQFSIAVISALLAGPSATQPHAGMLRYPDVGKTQIAFLYAGDVWLAPRAGGMATRLTTAPGQEAFPKFSPDGKTLIWCRNRHNDHPHETNVFVADWKD